ncbi:MAG: ABC transporter permease, partial [Pseudomonadota bacterium]
CITHRGNQVVSGVALNILAAGLAITLALNWYQMGGLTPKLEGDARFTPITLWVAEALAGIPLIGPIYASTLSGHSALVYMAFIAVPITWFLLFQTRFGLRLRAVGENPSALDVAGLSVDRMRYLALIAGSVFCGLAGTYLAVAANAGFVRDMTAGRGFIALAAVIFGKWMPGKVLIACLLFGALDGIAILLQGVEIAGLGQVPVQLIEALPYGLTIVLLAGLVGKSVPPQSIGIPYVKDR